MNNEKLEATIGLSLTALPKVVPLTPAPNTVLERPLLFRRHAFGQMRKNSLEGFSTKAPPKCWALSHKIAASADSKKEDNDGGYL